MYRNIYRDKKNLQHYFGTYCYKTIEEAKKAASEAIIATCIKTIEVPHKFYKSYLSIFNIEYEGRSNYIIYK